jgi:cell division protein FtsB
MARMTVLGKVWFALKCLAAVQCFCGAVLIAIRFECETHTPYIGWGISCAILLSGLFIVVDFGCVKRTIDHLQEEKAHYVNNSEHLEDLSSHYDSLISKLRLQITQRDQLLRSYSDDNDRLKRTIDEMEREINELTMTSSLQTQDIAAQATQIRDLKETVFTLRLENSNLRDDIGSEESY